MLPSEDAQVIAGGISGLLGLGMALFFAYFPGIKTRFGALSKDKKGAIQMGLLLLFTAGSYVLDLAGALELYPDGWAGIFLAVGVLIAGLAGNQGTYLTVVRPRKK